MTSDLLDAWLPDAAIRVHHRRIAAADPERLWACARAVRLADARTLGHLVRWRIPGTRAGQTFDELFRLYPFTVLEEGDRFVVSGMCGRIWTLTRDYPELRGPKQFRDWKEHGTVRVALATGVRASADGAAEIFSEARVAPVDRFAARRLRALWALLHPSERLIGTEGLTVAVRCAEAH